MNQRFVLGMLVAFVFIAFTQCTVEKRLYRNGWHVEFNRKPKSIKKDVVNRESAAATTVERSSEERTSELPEEAAHLLIQTDSVLASDPETKHLPLKPAKPIAENTNSNKLTFQAKSPAKVTAEQKRPYDQHDKNLRVIVLSILLLFFLVAIILLLVSLMTTAFIEDAIFFVLLLVLTVPIAFVLLVFLLVVLFTRTTKQLAEQKRLEAEEKEKLERMTPEEREAHTKEDLSRARTEKNNTIAATILGVAIVLLAILALSGK